MVFMKRVEEFLKQCGNTGATNPWLAYSRHALMALFKKEGFQLLAQVVQNGFCVGFSISRPPQQGPLFVPCIRSSLVPQLVQIPIKERARFAYDYETTKKRLATMKKLLPGLSIKAKVADRASKKVVGFVLDNEMYIPVQPAIALDNIYDQLPTTYGMDYFEADAQIFSNQTDEKRLQANLFQLENNFYRLFLLQIRQRINQPENIRQRKEIVAKLQEKTTQAKDVALLLKEVANDYATFQDMDPKALQSLADIHSCQVQSGDQPVKLCIQTKDEKQKYVFPRTNLVDRSKSNETEYFQKLAAELIHNSRVRKLVLQPNFLFFKDTTSSLEKADNEVIVLESKLKAYIESVSFLSANHPQYFRYNTFQIKEPTVPLKPPYY
jgi:hypothetical protein